MRKSQHARTEGVAGSVFRSGEAELGEGVETAANGGAGEAGLNAELRDGHLRRLLREGLDDDESTRQGRHEIGVSGVDVECGGRSDFGAGSNSGRSGGEDWLAGGEAHAGSLSFAGWRTGMFDRRTTTTINAQRDCRKAGDERVGA